MKQKDLNDLRNKTKPELQSLIAKTRKDIAVAKMELFMHRSKNTNAAKNLKKNLAQMLTICKVLPE